MHSPQRMHDVLHVCFKDGMVGKALSKSSVLSDGCVSVSAVIGTHSTHWQCGQHLYNVLLHFFSGSALSEVAVGCIGDSSWLMCDHGLGIYTYLRKKQTNKRLRNSKSCDMSRWTFGSCHSSSIRGGAKLCYMLATYSNPYCMMVFPFSRAFHWPTVFMQILAMLIVIML